LVSDFPLQQPIDIKCCDEDEDGEEEDDKNVRTFFDIEELSE
jgi:hypothetical protein